MPTQAPRSALPVVIAGALVVALVLWANHAERVRPGTPADAPAARVADAPPAPASPDPAPVDEALDASKGPPQEQDAFDLPDTPWAAVDLGRVREAMPDNLFWKMAMPTRDPDVLRAREEERARWNVEYGKVLSNTATAEEIDAFYAHRQKLSGDYVEFATFVLAEYGDKLPQRDVGLLKVAVELNLARLQEIPRQIEEANERRVKHDAARRAWLEQQRAFDEK